MKRYKLVGSTSSENAGMLIKLERADGEWMRSADVEQLFRDYEATRAINVRLQAEVDARKWHPIESAPVSGEFLVWIPSTDLAWPAYRNGIWIKSNAHGLLNAPDDHGQVLIATHWMPLLSPPGSVQEAPKAPTCGWGGSYGYCVLEPGHSGVHQLPNRPAQSSQEAPAAENPDRHYDDGAGWVHACGEPLSSFIAQCPKCCEHCQAGIPLSANRKRHESDLGVWKCQAQPSQGDPHE